MRMDTAVTLIREQPGNGYKGAPEIVESRETWCAEELVGSTTCWTAKSQNVKLSKTIVIWKWDRVEFTHAQIDGVKYQISDAGKAKDNRQMKLHLVRG